MQIPILFGTDIFILSQRDLIKLSNFVSLVFPWWFRQWRICLQCGRPGFDFWVEKISWRREWLPTPVFLPGEFHGQRNVVDYSQWGGKESDRTEQLTLFHFVRCKYKILFKEPLWRRQWHPTPVLLPGKSHGWRSLVGCSPWGHEESDTTEWLHFHFSLSCIREGDGNPL